MIAEQEKNRTVTSTLVAAGAEDVEMQIADDAKVHVMDMMSKMLYSDPELAVVREYICNAYDAHIEAGIDRAIEVTTPVGTFSDPYLTVEDFGVGLTKSEIREIYSQYGRSTKRSTNDQIGALGLGCKSGFALGDQFTVVSTRNCMTITVSVERNEAGAGVMRVISETKTSQPNGTKVIIPISPGSLVTDKATKFLRMGSWGDKVLLNGSPVPPITGLKLADDLLLIDGDQSYVVMGGVPYPTAIETGLPYGWQRGRHREAKSVVATVPIGSVGIANSREALRDNAATKAKLGQIAADVKAALEVAVQAEIDKAATPREAAMLKLKWAYDLAQEDSEFTYKGRAIPRSWAPATDMTVVDKYSNSGEAVVKMMTTLNDDYKMSRFDTADKLRIGQWDSTMIVWGFDKRNMTVTIKKKLMEYLVQNWPSFTVRQFALVASRPSKADIEWFGADHVIPWADVAAIKLPRTVLGQVTASGRLPGSYDLYRGFSQTEWDAAKAAVAAGTANRWNSGSDDGHVWEAGIAGDQIDQSRPVYFVTGRMGDAANYIELLAEIHRATGCYIVALTSNRVDKFQRIIPTARHPREGVREAWEKLAKTITPDERLALHVQEGSLDLVHLDAAKLKDPDLIKAIDLAKKDVSAWNKRRQKYGRVVDAALPDAVEWSNPLKRYPLFTNYYEYGFRRGTNQKFGPDMYLYMNAKYEDLKSNGSL